MKSRFLALLVSCAFALFFCTWFSDRGQAELKAQTQSPQELKRHELICAEAEMELINSFVAYAKTSNEEARGIFPPAFFKIMDLKREIIRTYLSELEKDEPEMINVLVKRAEAEVQLTKQRLEKETHEAKRRLLESALSFAEKRVELAKSLYDHEAQQDFLIKQLSLDVLHLRLDLELTR